MSAMLSPRRMPLLAFYLVATAAMVAMAQDASSTTTTPSTLSTAVSTSPTTSSLDSVATTSPAASSNSTGMPRPSDSAPGGSGSGSGAGSGSGSHHTNSDSDGLINYYFIFLAFILAIIGLASFFIYKRKRKAIMNITHSRQAALARDIGGWGHLGTGRRYWHGRWRGAEDMSREEGLNEHGEAPPPYVPKTNPGDGTDGQDLAGPAVPLQALNRDHVGLKPPDYTETTVHPVSEVSDGGAPSGSRPSQ